MGRPHQHSLHRYAYPINCQLAECRPLASRLLKAQPADMGIEALVDALAAATQFASLAADENRWAHDRIHGRDSAIVQHLSWMEAMQNELKAIDARHWRTIAEEAMLIGYRLAVLPHWFACGDTIEKLLDHVDGKITWKHFVCLLDAICEIDVFPPVCFSPMEAEEYEQRQSKLDPTLPPLRSADQFILVPATADLQTAIKADQALCIGLMDIAVTDRLTAAKFALRIKPLLFSPRRFVESCLRCPP